MGEVRILNHDLPANRALSESVVFLARAVERRDRLLKLAYPVFELGLGPLPGLQRVVVVVLASGGGWPALGAASLCPAGHYSEKKARRWRKFGRVAPITVGAA